MDSDDERDFKYGTDSKTHRLTLFERDNLELRLYELEQVEKCPRRGTVATNESGVAHYRLLRFLRTVKGFHQVSCWARFCQCHRRLSNLTIQGSLDLSGRHQRRYDSISLRFKKFLEGILPIINSFPHHSSDENEFIVQRYLKSWNVFMATSHLALKQELSK